MLLFFDIDGTLIDDRTHQVPASVKPALEEASARGHRIVINTGRTLCNMDERLDALPIDGWIMGCGTRIVWEGETLQSMEHSPQETMKLRDVFLRLRIPTVYECDTAMYFDPAGPSHEAIEGFSRFALGRGIARDIREGDAEFRAVKMFCFPEKDEDIQHLERETAALGMPYTGIQRAPIGWEIVPAGYSKGQGIDMLREKLGLPFEACFAFGDSSNDLTMLRHVKHSIAMGNAEEAVKAVCSYVTARPGEDGIEKALRHFGLIGEKRRTDA